MHYRLILPTLVILWTGLSFALKLPPVSLAVTPLFLLYWVWREGWGGLSPALVLLLGQATAYIILFKTTQNQNITLGWIVGAGALILFLLAYLRAQDIRENTVQRKALKALELGTLRLGQAQSSEDVMAAGLDAIRALELAPHLAFVQPYEGKLRILSGRGGFAKYEGRVVSSAGRNPRQTQVESLIRHVSDSIPEATTWEILALLVGGHGGKALGTVLVARENGIAFSETERSLLNSLTRLFGAYLGQVASLRDLERSHESAHMTLGLALEYRDYETPGHTGRVVEMAEILGQHLGLSLNERTCLRAGAYLHDIGKLVIADSVLLKPDTLTFEEREEMEKHALIGYELLAKLGFVPLEALEVVKYHHERWDGGGYPQGMSGTDIPYLARIFGVIDLYDALTHVRPYKKTFTPQEAIVEVEAQASKQLDPFVVADFLALWKDGKLKVIDREVFSFTRRASEV